MSRDEARQLLTGYFDGGLSAGERQQFLDAILADQDLYNAFAEEAVLAELLQDADFRAEVRVAVAGPTVPFIAGWRNGWRWALAVAMAALVLILAIGVYRGRSQREPVRDAVPAVVTTFLTSTERGSNAPKHAIMVDGYRTVRLLMNVPEGLYRSYRATLRGAGSFEREFRDLQPRGGPGGRHLELDLPAYLLQAGDYTVEVLGATASGGLEPAAGYEFAVMRKNRPK